MQLQATAEKLKTMEVVIKGEKHRTVTAEQRADRWELRAKNAEEEVLAAEAHLEQLQAEISALNKHKAGSARTSSAAMDKRPPKLAGPTNANSPSRLQQVSHVIVRIHNRAEKSMWREWLESSLS